MGRSLVIRACIVATLAVSGGAAVLVHVGLPVRAANVAAPARCSNVQVVIRRGPPLGAAAGHIGVWFRVHHLFGPACTLQGYPGVELLDKDFHSLPTHLKRAHGYIIAGSPPVRQVVVDQGHDGFFALEYSDVPVGNQPCVAAPYLLVTPPNDFLPDVAYSGGLLPCAGNIGVSPMQAVAKLGSQ